MKKFLAITLVIGTIIALSGCKKKEEERIVSSSSVSVVSQAVSKAPVSQAENYYPDHSILGTWYKTIGEEMGEYTFYDDGTYELVTYKEVDEDWPENHTQAIGDFRLYKFRDRDAFEAPPYLVGIDLHGGDKVLYWEIIKDESGREILHVWEEDKEGNLLMGQDYYFSRDKVWPS